MESSPSSSARCSTDSAYVLDNASKEAVDRFAALSAAFDPGTIRHFQDRGVGLGWHCLEVGGGGGSIASWLANRVGSAGRVLVTDIDPRYLDSLKLPNVEVRGHDIVNDPLPEASFDLIHARLVLVHLPQREKVLARLVTALKPGGWIIDEEFDSVVVPDPTLHPAEVLSKTHNAMIRIMADRGVERGFGRRLFGLLRAHGLASVGAEGRTFMWPSGSPGPSLMRSNYEQLRGAMIDAGYVTAEVFDQDVASLGDPSFLMPSPLLWAAWGRRP
jgi:SAM-dependent methyltransferase